MELKVSSVHYPSELPILSRKDDIVEAVKVARVVVVAGSTGSGKSTQLPKFCLEAGKGLRGIIACTQPRRIAAIALSKQVAKELAPEGNLLVGYKIRFQDRTSKETVIKFVTDGILLAEAQSDKLLRRYEVVIIDEAHERSLNIDFLIGLLRQILVMRDDLSVIISSATINPQKFADVFKESLRCDVPIIEIASKSYPVEVLYKSQNPDASEDGMLSYVDQAVATVEEVLLKEEMLYRGGDFLIFMPTERDIRETVQRLRERDLPNVMVYPLYGRQPSWEQDAIFERSKHRKIIVATNVAETSLTIPNVTYVIDTGLARISHYSVKTGIKALPIMPISKASADQRKGRCGRTGPGLCIRLYTEEDYETRQAFTPPEIKRSNLAEVILRMLYLDLGDVETFPFIDPPSKGALREGFITLRQLGAIDEKRRLTGLGRKMARLPLDPRLSRVLIEAGKRKALKEILVIVSALTIQDPRERPSGQEKEADEAHNLFANPQSDFLAFLNIWQAYQREQKKGLGRNQLHKWCRKHYLSARRMQEWISIHDELMELLKEIGGLEYNEGFPSYKDIHCSLLSGFLCSSGGLIALHQGKGVYRTSKDKEVFIFPGSFVKKFPTWIMASEIVETSRIFARNVAEIDPLWVEEVGGALCVYSYKDPHWDKAKGNVLAFENVSFQSLPIVQNRVVLYGHIKSEEAREIFIREGLLEDNLGKTYPFMEHNRKLIVEVKAVEERIRRRSLMVDKETIFRFYDARIPEGVWSLKGLEKFLRTAADETPGSVSCRSKFPRDHLLRMSQEDVMRSALSDDVEKNFPGRIDLYGCEFPLKYHFGPGSEEDGVSIIATVSSLETIKRAFLEGLLDWPLPGYLEEKVLHFLKSLPKDIRKGIFPLGETARAILPKLRYEKVLPEVGFFDEVRRCLGDVKGVWITPADWRKDAMPGYLNFRLEVVDSKGKVLAAGRDIASLVASVPDHYRDQLWEKAKLRWERTNIKEIPKEPLPDSIELAKDSSVGTILAYPGLVDEGKEGVSLKLFNSSGEAQRSTAKALVKLVMVILAPSINRFAGAWIIPPRLQASAFFMMEKTSVGMVNEQLKTFVVRDMLGIPFALPVSQVTQEILGEKIEFMRKNLFALADERLRKVWYLIERREEIRRTLLKYREKGTSRPEGPVVVERINILMKELEELVPPDFLSVYTLDDLNKALDLLDYVKIRSERAYVFPAKDISKETVVKPYEEKYRRVSAYMKEHFDDAVALEKFISFKWLISGYKACVFTPELFGRASSLRQVKHYSPKVLDEEWQTWKRIIGVS